MATLDVSISRQFVNPKYYESDYTFTYSGGSGGGTIVESDVTKAYVDGSLALRDNQISVINSSLNDSYDAAMFFIPEVSLNDSYFKWIGGYLEPSIAGGGTGDVTKLYVDGSLAVRDARIAAINASLGDEDNILSYVNTSTYYDGSLNLRVLKTLFDSSILSLTNKNISQDASLGLRPLTTYVDGSLNAKANKNATIVYKTSQYEVSTGDNNYIIEASGTFNMVFPTAIDAGFQTTVVNIGGGTITMVAKLGALILTKDSSTKLTKRYTGATAYSRGSNQWVIMGDLN